MNKYTIREGTLGGISRMDCHNDELSAQPNPSVAAPSPILCLEKERLIFAFAKAAIEYNRLYSARVLALSRGEDPPPLEHLEDAELQKENAKYAIVLHQEVHGC